jgi:AcrR family transcriptional regulator
MTAKAAPAQRRTHAERSAETRGRVLDATLDCLFEKGCAGTSTLAVQERAGVSRGALTYHFASRSELLIAAVEHLAHARLEQLRKDAALLPNGEDRVERAIELAWDTFTGPLWFAAADLWNAARTDPSLRRALAPRERAFGQELREAYIEVFGPDIASRPEFDDVFDLTLNIMRGLALTNILRTRGSRDRELVDRWKRIANTLLSG